MAGELASAFVRIRPQDAGFRQELRQDVTAATRAVGREAQVEVRADMHGFHNDVERDAKRTFRQVAQIGAGVTGGLIAVEGFREVGRLIRELVSASTEEEVRARLLDKAITNAGASHRAFGKDIEDVIDKESRLSGFTDQELSSSLARLVQATGNTGQALNDLGLAEDVSRVRKIQLGQASIALAKTEQGSTTSLARLGVIIPKVTAEQDKLRKARAEAVAQGAIFSKQQDLLFQQQLAAAAAHDKEASRLNALAQVRKRFGGSAREFADTTAGALSRLKVAQNELAESLGIAVLPAISKEALALADLIGRLQDSGEVQDGVATSGRLAAQTLQLVGDVAQEIGPPLLAAARAAGQVASAIGPGPILAGIAAYKGLNIAIHLAEVAEAKYLKTKAAVLGVDAKEAGAKTRSTEASTAAAASRGREAEASAAVAAAETREAETTNAVALARARAAEAATAAAGASAREADASVAATAAKTREAAVSDALAAAEARTVDSTLASAAARLRVAEASEAASAATARGVAASEASVVAKGREVEASLAVAAALEREAAAAGAAGAAKASAAGGAVTAGAVAGRRTSTVTAGSGAAATQASADASVAATAAKEREAAASTRLATATQTATGASVVATAAKEREAAASTGLAATLAREAAASEALATAKAREVAAAEAAAASSATARAREAAAVGSVAAAKAAQASSTQAVVSADAAQTNASAGVTAANVREADSATGVAAANARAAEAGMAAAAANERLALTENTLIGLLGRRVGAMNLATGVNTRYAETTAAAAAANTAFAASEVEAGAASVARAGRLATAAGGIGRSALSLVGGPQGAVVLGLAAAAAGLVYLMRRQTEWERSNERVKGSLRALDEGVKTSTKLRRDLGDVTGSITSDRLSVTSARLAVEQAKVNLATSKAAPGSIAARENALRLAQAQDQLRNAIRQLGRDEEEQAKTEQQIDAQRDARRAKVAEGVAAIQKLSAQVREIKFSDPFFNATHQSELARRQVEKFTHALERQGTVGGEAVAGLARKLGRIPTRKEIRFILNEASVGKSVDEILLQLKLDTARAAGEAGKTGGAAFAAGLAATGQALREVAKKKGEDAGLSFGQGVLAGIGNTKNIPTGLKRLLDGVKKQAVDSTKGGAADAAIGTTKADAAIAAAAKKQADAAAKALGAARAHLNEIQGEAREQIDSAASAVREAQDQLALTIEQGQREITEAVTSSKQNLDQIGQSLSERIGALLDKRGAGPAVDKVPAALRKQFRDLKNELAAGASDPKIARDSAALAQAIQRHQSTASGESPDLEKVKERIRRNIADLTFEFNKGALNEGQFNARLNKILRGSHITVKNAAKLLGSAFAGDLQAQIRGLRLQAGAEAAGPHRPGSGLEPSIVKPLETVAQVQRETAAAQKELGNAQLTESKEQTRQAKLIHGQLVKIEAAVKAARFFEPQTRPDGAPGRRTKGMTSAGARRP